MFCDDGILIQLLQILDIMDRPVFIRTQRFRRLDSVLIFRWDLLSWDQYTELVSASEDRIQNAVFET
jgi:hypothetical protein